MRPLILLLVCLSTLFSEEIRYSYDPYPPFTYEDASTQEVKGRAVEIIHALFSRMNLDVKTELKPWSYVLEEMKVGAVDVTFPMPVQLESYIVFSQPVFMDRVMLYSRKENGFCWDEIKNNQKLQVGFVKAYSYGEEWDHLINSAVVDIVMHYDPNNFPKLLKHKRIDAYIKSEITGDYQLSLSKSDQANIVSCPKHIYASPWHLGVSKKSPLAARIDEIRQVLKAMKESGEIERILQCDGCVLK